MPVHDIVVLTLIVTVFVAFGIVLAWVRWYCERPHQRENNRHSGYPTHSQHFVVDD
jgi:hypothetical protein